MTVGTTVKVSKEKERLISTPDSSPAITSRVLRHGRLGLGRYHVIPVLAPKLVISQAVFGFAQPGVVTKPLNQESY